jgi:hypothetical protein
MDLAQAEGTPQKSETIMVELGGNTLEWQDAVKTFVQDNLTISLASESAVPVEVRAIVEIQGKTSPPPDSCLSRRLILTPGQQELSKYRRASAATKSEMERQFETLRKKQIDIVVGAFVDVVKNTSFDIAPGTPQVFTPLPLWLDASKMEGDIAILSPLLSNAGDCLDTKGVPTAAKQVVSDCVASGVMPKLDSARLKIDFPSFLTAEAGQKVAVRDMLDSLATCATTIGCA